MDAKITASKVIDTLIPNIDEYDAKRFVGIALVGQELRDKTFEGCEFKSCDFSGATLSKCKFIECHFTDCNLSLAKVTLSKFREVVFNQCKVVGVNWTTAAWQKLVTSSPLKFHQCILNDSSFLGLSLQEFVIEDCKARDVDFREADLRQANCSYTDFANSLFGKTNLSGADFTEAVNYDIDVFRNDIKNAKFTRSEAIRLLDCLQIELIS